MDHIETSVNVGRPKVYFTLKFQYVIEIPEKK